MYVHLHRHHAAIVLYEKGWTTISEPVQCAGFRYRAWQWKVGLDEIKEVLVVGNAASA